jgi:hypothetical protein
VHCKITNKNTITDIAHSGSWSSYVHSSDVIQDGRVSLRFGQTDRQVMFGFSDTFSSQSFSVLNYAIFSNNGVISIRESGNIPKSLPSFDKHTIDDVFSVEYNDLK